MKNLYALNQENQLIHIQNVDKKFKEKYTCCNCNGELIPRKGKIKAHHFSHKVENNCSYESYLHKVSKIKFFEEYSDCLKNKKPFFIEYKVNQTCISCKNIERINLSCELGFRKQKLDLTKWFDKIKIEKNHNGFIADIFLKSSKTGEIIFIEFAVTHQCEKEKIESGIRIIEIDLINENDLNFIEKRFIPANKENIKFFNFKTKEEKKTYYDPKICNRNFEVFSVSINNQSIKRNTPMKKIFQDLQNFDFKHYQILPFQEEEYGGEKFINLVKELAFKDPKYKNCYSCRFITKNNSYFAEYNLFCKRLRCEISNSNFGGNCEKYWRIEKLISFE
ncbi:competence protein CoiA family protein [uncultured Christiangramia sp.]|uniref:competence protein CoiA family protein n=1 Tax=uncultured Christiangramia sp. TaxID=503836 RepID=UPI002602F851|nr:competence protein CoiA family protein [uncultured Christiangramia sp.]